MQDPDVQVDPVERTRKYKRVVARAEAMAHERAVAFGLGARTLGYCHFFWAAKKDILWDKFGIEWRTPAEMNPEVCFD